MERAAEEVNAAGGSQKELEHYPADDDRQAAAPALEALRLHWGYWFEIGRDVHGWYYRRRDGIGGRVAAPGPDELQRLIAEDWAFFPVRMPLPAARVQGGAWAHRAPRPACRPADTVTRKPLARAALARTADALRREDT